MVPVKHLISLTSPLQQTDGLERQFFPLRSRSNHLGNSLKTLTPENHPTHLNQAVWGCDMGIGIFNKLPGRFFWAAKALLKANRIREIDRNVHRNEEE